MKDDRLRVPVEPDYLVSIGRATFCFAGLEWNAVTCGGKLSPGFINTVAKMTAGKIADEIVEFGPLIKDEAKRTRYQAAVGEFKRLVKRRNDLVHSTPATTVDNEQRLFRFGKPWQPAEIDDLADEFTACSSELNELFHHVL